MPSCIVPGCNNRSGEALKGKVQKEIEKAKGANITFHRLPLNLMKRMKWLDNLGISMPQQKNPMVCCVHFKESAFDKTSLSCVRLKETAVPCVTVSENEAVSPYETKFFIKESLEPTVQITIPRDVPIKQTEIENKNNLDRTDELTLRSMKESKNTMYDELQLVEEKRFVYSSMTTSSEQFYNLHKKHQSKAKSPLSISNTISDSLQKRYSHRTLENMKNFYEKEIELLVQKYRQLKKREALLRDVLKSLKTKRYLTGTTGSST
ncbi:uncharacterized protein LOC105696151 [Orussus abietinus]|uniref:uncharacterized protein LOC105696151 n=1 Tax=Orussus abietinus TaxID=222816 RepID=UPI000624FC37|nr:uncharacterized protein LOC105696151 [Orussus abietinus]